MLAAEQRKCIKMLGEKLEKELFILVKDMIICQLCEPDCLKEHIELCEGGDSEIAEEFSAAMSKDPGEVEYFLAIFISIIREIKEDDVIRNAKRD